VSGSPVTLHAHKSKEDRVLGSFRIRGRKVSNSPTIVSAKCKGLPTAEAMVQVIENIVEERSFIETLEFERGEYRVRQGSRKSLRLFAKYPELVTEDLEITAQSSDTSKVVVITLTVVAANRTLRAAGWRVLRIWEHELTKGQEKKLLNRIRRFLPENLS
jgi:hypothetical protein